MPSSSNSTTPSGSGPSDPESSDLAFDPAFDLESQVDGQRLRVHVFGQALGARAGVVIAHGIGEHGLRYRAFAEALVAAGHVVWALDHRGHGASIGAAGLGVPGAFVSAAAAWVAMVSDLGQLVDVAREELADAAPLVLFGHSMGSLLAQALCLKGAHPLDALVLSGSLVMEREAPADPEAPAGFHPGNLHELGNLNAPFEPARTAFDWLSRDAEQVDAYVKDPLCGFDAATGARFFGPLELMALADPARLSKLPPELPVLLVAGSADPLNRQLQGLLRLRELWRAAGVEQIDSFFYAGGRHEMLHETNRDEVIRDLLRWIGARRRLANAP